MFKNYSQIAIRTLLKNKVFSTINILGLSLGFAGFIYISLYIHHESSFDTHHFESENVYRLVIGPLSRNVMSKATGGGVMAPIIQDEYPGIEAIARFRRFPSLITFEENMFYENEFYFTDSTVFDVFPNQFVAGNPETALVEPNSIVLTESKALKIFGSTANVIGKILTIDNQLSYRITGIIKDSPGRSHFRYDYLASIASIPTHHNVPLRTYQMTSWYAHYFYTYFRLSKNTDPKELGSQLKLAAKYHSNPENYQRYGTNLGLFLQPIADVHLNPLRREIRPQGNKQTLYILGAVAIVILLLGSFNYTNLTTAQSLKRSKEVGLRKTLGAAKNQLIFQFILESLFTTLIALVISLTAIQVTLPFFNNQFDTTLVLWSADNIYVFTFVLACSVITGLLGGFYPALVISSYKPTAILKGIEKPAGGIALRKLIVLVQFVISMILISGTVIIYQQVQFMKNTALGIDTEQVMVIPINENESIISEYVRLKERLRDIPGVKHSTICEVTPGDSFGGIVARFEGMTENESFPTTGVSFDYIKTFGIKMLAGRDFDVRIATDSIERIIINRTLANELGWTPEEAVNKKYDFGGDGETPGRVIGVMEDFHFNTLRSSIAPLVLAIRPHFYDRIAIRLQGADIPSSIAQIESAWQQVFPTWPLEFYFADDHYNRQYRAEEQFGGIILSFSIMALLIGGLGLLGIVMINTRQRLKEICIRKTLGARLINILRILSKEYILILSLSFALSVPLSYFLATTWLENFAYQMDSYVWLTIYSPVLVVITALTTIAILAVKSAQANPVEVLRNE